MGRLTIISTPIGNLEDITLRALRRLAELSALACEDTRRTRVLLESHKIKIPKILIAYHDHNEERACGKVMAYLDSGMSVGLVSDGGTPVVSDPGFRIISAAVAKGHEIEVLPGPNAVVNALVASGLPPSSFTFLGFPPRKPGPLKRLFEAEIQSPHTLILFESPMRLGKLLHAAQAVLGNRRAAVCVEMTKLFERVERGRLEELALLYKEKPPKGEVTIVIEGMTRQLMREARCKG